MSLPLRSHLLFLLGAAYHPVTKRLVHPDADGGTGAQLKNKKQIRARPLLLRLAPHKSAMKRADLNAHPGSER
jgi:hypothetical protein